MIGYNFINIIMLINTFAMYKIIVLISFIFFILIVYCVHDNYVNELITL